MEKNQLYRAKIRIGHDADGKPIDKYLSAKTAEALQKKKDAAVEHFIRGKAVPKETLFYEYAAEWYAVKKEPFISDSQKKSYKVCFMKHLLPEFGLQHMEAISATQIQQFINGFAGSSKSQITMMVGALKQIFASAYAEGVIERDPTVAIVRPKASAVNEKRSLTAEETANVKKTMQTHPDGLLLAVLYYLGLRRGETLGLKWSDFDENLENVHIQRDIDFAGSKAKEGGLKTKAADRFVPVPAELKAMLQAQKRQGDSYLFPDKKGGPISQSTFKRIWCELMVCCGCVEWREISETTNRPNDILKQVKPTLTPHYFRHNYVTLLYESGIDPLMAMKIVGHADYQTTANIYTHLKEESLQRAHVNLDKVFAGK
ncbi:MAG TPA: tyrosine-type recombinase/integrase, partial [Methanocorpusculum sp.]|nr:tyrosine-type recombinase/integrase [Methanocorpusculum sp.]